MRVKKLHIRNFRGLKELTFEPPKDLAVLIGINGSGKSTLLDAFAILLSQYSAPYLYSNPFSDLGTHDFPFTEDDIHIDGASSHLNIEVSTDASEHSYSWSINQYRPGVGDPTHSRITDDFRELSRAASVNGQSPVLAYYQTDRMAINSSVDVVVKDKKNGISASKFPAYENAFAAKNISTFHDFFSWFENEESYENEVRLREDINFKNPSLEIVRQAIHRFLNQFSDVHFENLRIVRSKGASQFRVQNSIVAPTLIIDKNKQELPIHLLSAGEKSLLMIVVDIARRLALLGADSAAPLSALNGVGIILIDEIDLHLHPAWQRSVVSGLRRTFPNCQFIVTTHSPQVLSKVPSKNVFLLEEGKIWPADSTTLGRDTNAILSELMGVSERPIETKEKINACLHLIDEGHLKQAEESLNELERTLGRFDTEVVRARTLIDFLSRKGHEEDS